MPLSDNLVSWYSFDEALGSFIDEHGANDIPVFNAPGSVAGHIGNARDFEAGSSQRGEIASNADFTRGDTDFSYVGWLKLESHTGTILSKFQDDTGKEYISYMAGARLRWVLSADGTTETTLQGNTYGDIPLDTWVFVALRHDSVNNLIRLRIDTVDHSVAHAGGSSGAGTRAFMFGSYTNPYYLDGALDEWGFWHRHLSDAELDELYNAGAGRDYAYVSGGAANTLDLLFPPDDHFYQRDLAGGTTGVVVSGESDDEGGAVAYRLNGAGAWTELDAEIEDGEFSGTIDLPDGWNLIEVRLVSDTDVTDSAQDICVGDAWVIEWQSGAEGRFAEPQPYVGNGFKVWKEGAIAWTDGADPTDADTALGSLWPRVATKVEAYRGYPVAFFTFADGGTAASEWLPGQPKYDQALAQILASGINGIKGCILFGGESDAIAGTTEAALEADVEAIAAALNSDLPGAPPTFLIQIGKLTFMAPPAAQIDAVKKGLWDAATDSPHIFHGATTDDLNNDGLHLVTGEHADIVTSRLFLSFKENLYGGGAVGRGPQITSAILNAGLDEITVATDQTLKVGLVFDTEPWEVDDDGTPRVVSAVAYHPSDVTALVLSLAAPCTGAPGTIFLDFGSGNTKAGMIVPIGPDRALPDASVANLPLESQYNISVGESAITLTPAPSIIEFAGSNPSVILGSLTLTPAASAIEFAGDNPNVLVGSDVQPNRIEFILGITRRVEFPMPVAFADIRLNDIGTVFAVQIVDEAGKPVDVSQAVTLTIRFKPPGKPTRSLAATLDTDGVNGKVAYAVIAGDLDTVGTWGIQGFASFGASAQFSSRPATFRVESNY